MGILLNKKCQCSSCVLLCKYSIYLVFTNEEIVNSIQTLFTNNKF
jgi:hypothetical protein